MSLGDLLSLILLFGAVAAFAAGAARQALRSEKLDAIFPRAAML
jgi:hypothetical protein